MTFDSDEDAPPAGGAAGAPRLHGRLPWPAPDKLAPEQRALYDAIVAGPPGRTREFAVVDGEGRLEGPFNAMVVNPALGTAVHALGSALRYTEASLTAVQREVAILELARIRRSAYEWYAHARVARARGLTDSAIAALRRGAPSDELDSADSLVRDVVRTLLGDRDLDDALFERAAGTLGLAAVADLVVLVGYYDLLALSLAVWRTPLPAGEPEPDWDAP